MKTKESAQFDGTFRYNGKELALIKEWAGTAHPQKAVEKFIYTALYHYRNPQEMLEELTNGQLDQKPLEKK